MGEAVEHFSYDKVGNRLTDNVTTGNWVYNQNNELQDFDNTSFKYNLNGQVTEKIVNGTKTYYSYNLDGRLNEIKDNASQVIAQYEYDPFGRRLTKTLPQTTEITYFHYSEEGLVAEYDETGQLIQSYGYQPYSYFTTDVVFTYRPDYTEAKGYAYYIKDHLGTPKKLITNTGRKVWEASEDAFGKTVITNNEFRNPLRFAGQYSDNESNLRYNYHRYYDPSLGRYITSDPIGLEGGLNTYAYVDNDPLNWIDPFGLSKFGDLKKAVQQVHDILGGSLPKGKPGKFGSSQRGDSKKGYRYDKEGHPKTTNPNETGPHVNYWDYTKGKRGKGGVSDAVPVPPKPKKGKGSIVRDWLIPPSIQLACEIDPCSPMCMALGYDCSSNLECEI